MGCSWQTCQLPATPAKPQSQVNERFLHFSFHKAVWQVGYRPHCRAIPQTMCQPQQGGCRRFGRRQKEETGRGWKINRGTTEKQQGGNTGRQSRKGAEGRDGETLGKRGVLEGGRHRPRESDKATATLVHLPLCPTGHTSQKTGTPRSKGGTRHVQCRALSTCNYRSVSGTITLSSLLIPQPPSCDLLPSQLTSSKLRVRRKGRRSYLFI